MTDEIPRLPRRFGQFYLYDFIGKGGMAEIFLAKTFTGLGTERHCAIKRIRPSFIANEDFFEMLINEAKLCARLSHANIVQTYDLGRIDGQFYIAMEYVEGLDLNALLGLLSRAKVALPLQFALYIIIETVRGLDYAHRLKDYDGRDLGIIHRDVSPTNVLISTEGEVKLCDFGIAKVALGDFDTAHLTEYHLKGKVAYMAPEHLAGEIVDCRADLFAAGILLWELLSGRRLFKRKDDEETLRLARVAEIPPLANRGFANHEMLSDLVTKALARRADDRFQTGQELMRALENYMRESSMMVSQIRFADFLVENFGGRLLEQRRLRERHLAELIVHQDTLDEETPAVAKEVERKSKEILAAFDDEPSGEVILGDALEMDEEEIAGRPLVVAVDSERGAAGSTEQEQSQPDSPGLEPVLSKTADEQRADQIPDASPPYFWIAAVTVVAIIAAVIYFFGFN